VGGAVGAGASVHVIDAVLPVSAGSFFKTALFRMDRVRHVRTFDALRAIVARHARVQHSEGLKGPLHDVCYIRAVPN
jgi:hypothetical protein